MAVLAMTGAGSAANGKIDHLCVWQGFAILYPGPLQSGIHPPYMIGDSRDIAGNYP
jgi:hypothetical protein